MTGRESRTAFELPEILRAFYGSAARDSARVSRYAPEVAAMATKAAATTKSANRSGQMKRR